MDRRTTRRRRGHALFAGFAVIALALAPAIAEARPGGSTSSGSRGSRTYTAPPSTQTAPGTASQFQRTETPRPAPGVNQAAPRPGMNPAPAGGFFSRNPLMAGLMGGLLGAGLFGLLSGHGLFGGLAGFAGFLGLLLQIGLIAGLVFLVVRLVRGRREPAMAGGPQGGNAYAYAQPTGQGYGPQSLAAGAAGAAVTARAIEIAAGDFQAFERALAEINAAWSRQDVDAISRLATPEMTRIFSQDLQDLKARGWTNQTRDVKLEAGDLSEAWSEGGQDFATVAMRFSLLDVTTDAGGRVVEGSATERQTATELWTFTRRGGSPWLLSAIQQTA